MAIEKVLTGSVVVIDLKPDGTLRASNVERQYTLSDGNVILARPVERDVLTAETLSSVLPTVAELAIKVQQLEGELSEAAQTASLLAGSEASLGESRARVTELDGQLRAAADELTAANSALQGKSAELEAASEELRIKSQALTEALARIEALQTEKAAAETALNATSTELAAKQSQLAEAATRAEALQTEKASIEAARGAALTELATVEQGLAATQSALDAALSQVAVFQAEKDAAAEKARLSVSPAAARVVLRNAGLLVAVEAAVEAADPHSDLRIFWEYSEVWRRESPFITQMGAALGLTSEQIDNLFAQAATQ